MAKYQQYEEYKDSGVKWLGQVPNEWSVARLKWCLTNNDGGVWGDDPKGVDDTIVLRSTEQTVDGRWKIGDPAVRNLSEHEKASALLETDDLLLTKSSGSSLHIGKTTIVTEDISRLNCCYSNFMQRLRVNNKLKSKLVWYLLNNNIAREQFEYFSSTTTGLANLNASIIGEVILPIYSAEEQSKIIKFLDHETAQIDTLIDKQQTLIQLLKEKRQAVISHAVTKGLNPNAPMKDSGVEWLGEVPEHWAVSPLKLYIDTRKGVAFKSVDFTDLGVRVVKASDIKEKTIRQSDVFLPVYFSETYPKAILCEGDIVISTVGSTPDVKNSAVGQIGMVPAELDGSLLNQNTVVFTPRNNMLENLFLFYLIQTDVYRDHLDLNAHGTANQASLNVSDMLNFTFARPSLKEQSEISEYIIEVNSNFDALEKNCLTAIQLMQERRTALISAAVTGKIDVRGWVAPN